MWATNALVQQLVDEGILGPELCPEPNYWHWPVLEPDKLPVYLGHHYKFYGEVRIYYVHDKYLPRDPGT